MEKNTQLLNVVFKHTHSLNHLIDSIDWFSFSIDTQQIKITKEKEKKKYDVNERYKERKRIENLDLSVINK